MYVMYVLLIKIHRGFHSYFVQVYEKMKAQIMIDNSTRLLIAGHR